MTVAVVVLSILLFGFLIYIFALDRIYAKTLTEVRRIYYQSVEEIREHYQESLNRMKERHDDT